ncbi:YybH family protein [Palleronia pontilimi]|nr:SgcJ/EcaC family oxidoreductase [Palleronia pontilimi]
MPALFVQAWMARDADALAALFAPDADFVNVVGLWWHDRDAIRRAHAYGLRGMFSASTLRVGRVKRRDLGGVCVLHARMHLDGQTAPDGSEAGPRQTVMSFVMARQGDGTWLCVSAHNTDIVPGAESHVNDGADLKPADYRD